MKPLPKKEMIENAIIHSTDLVRRIVADIPEDKLEEVSALASMSAADELNKRNAMLLSQDELVKRLMVAPPAERPQLIQRIGIPGRGILQLPQLVQLLFEKLSEDLRINGAAGPKLSLPE